MEAICDKLAKPNRLAMMDGRVIMTNYYLHLLDSSCYIVTMIDRRLSLSAMPVCAFLSYYTCRANVQLKTTYVYRNDNYHNTGIERRPQSKQR